MKDRNRIPFPLTVASALVLAANAALAETEEAAGEDIFTPLLLETRPLSTRWQTDYAGSAQLGLGYVSDDNYMFGQYNGLHEDGVTLIGNLRWQDFSNSDSYWRASVDDLGLDTREGELTWGRSDKLRVTVGFDSQLQVRNNTGRTPFRGSDNNLDLPDDWVSGSSTSDWTALEESLRQFDRELERETLYLDLATRLNDNWRLEAGFSYEDREGTGDVGGAFYVDASQGDAALLPAPVDYTTTEFDVGLLYSSASWQLEGRIDYSDFDNNDDVLLWENPYRTRNPGDGGLGLAPDNDQWRGRLTGQYIITPDARLQFDGSYAINSQDARFLDYTVNPNLAVTEPVPRSDYDGEVEIGTFNGKLWLRPLKKMNVELFYKARERDYDAPRDGYRYNRGDATDQPRQALTVYNTAHDYLSQTMGLEVSYRLPLRSRLTAEYAYENVERENAAVEETKEDIITVGYRIQPWDNFTARWETLFGNRNADTYQWDQRYYALLDVELINATPDNQRYINHPEMSQYHLANREQWQTKLDFSWQPLDSWNLNLNLMWQDEDFDKTYTGLREVEWRRAHLSANWAATSDLTATLYAGVDTYYSEQLGRAFRSGAEKNAFEIYPPLPQASDPDRDWQLESDDTSITVGASLQWQLSESLALEADYNFVDTEGEQDLRDYGAPDLDPQDFPAVETTLHHVTAAGTWHMNEQLSLRLDYQYYRYTSDDWAWQGVQADTIDKVLTFGQRNPNETIHYMGVSAIYRWQ